MSVTGPNPNAASQRGSTGGMSWTVQSSPTTSTLTYTAGKILGGLMTLNSFFIGRTGILQKIHIMDRASQSGAMNIYFFNTLPAGTYTDGSTFTMNGTDQDNNIFAVAVDATKYISGGGVSVQTITGIGDVQASANVGVIWAIAVANGAYTYAANSLTFTWGILQD